MSERESQREGRWKSDAYKVYTRNNTEEASQVSRKLAEEGMGSLRQPGQDTVWGKSQRERTTSDLEEFESSDLEESLNDRGPFGELGHPRPKSRSHAMGPEEGVIKLLHGVIAL